MKNYKQWAVIGAGPAGITCVAKLLDAGVSADEILWFDTDFEVGDFKKHWSHVPSNTKVNLFIKYLNHSENFNFSSIKNDLELLKLNENGHCELKYMAQALQLITEHLKSKVLSKQLLIKDMQKQSGRWQLQSSEENFLAEKVILATGSKAKKLAYTNIQEINLNTALHPEQLKREIAENDTIAVFGSSHSAILALKNLIEHTKFNKIYNFYCSPLRYAIPMGEFILFDDSGLKGSTAKWGRDHLDGNCPENLLRYLSNDEHIDQFLPHCNKVIYAVGFERNHLPVVKDISPLAYQPQTGIIAPGLFGCGIAFPEQKQTPLGFYESRVGLWKFMDYITKILPVWMEYPGR